MTHDILFRGKRIDTGKCVYGYYIQLNSSNETLHIIVDDHGEYHRVNPSTVGRFTGLTDKNGRKIFEGDTVQSKETGEIGIVQWFPEHSAFMVWRRSLNAIGFLYECAHIVEVIGNIYDDPELLGGE